MGNLGSRCPGSGVVPSFATYRRDLAHLPWFAVGIVHLDNRGYTTVWFCTHCSQYIRTRRLDGALRVHWPQRRP